MNIKDYIFPVALALLSTLFIRYYFVPGDTSKPLQSNNRSFVAPASCQAAEPLDLFVDFHDSSPAREKKITTVNTQYGNLDFSNDGGILQSLAYHRILAGNDGIISTLNPSENKEKGAFLVAFDGIGNTPYYYDLISSTPSDKGTSLVYKAESHTAIVTKEFFVHNDIYKIDLKLSVELKGDVKQLRPRIFFPAPFISDSSVTDIVKAVLYSEKHVIEKRALKDVALFGKEYPTLFGLEDHYFVNTLVSDPQKFAQRAYFKLEGSDFACAILQSPAIKEKTSWDLSFYFGPKESSALVKVDSRLDGVLDYGWFWFISKPLLQLLNLIYSYVKNYGLAIIIISILIKLLFLPFTLKGEMARQRHQDAQKKFKYIEQKYRDNPEILARERAEFMRKHGLGTMGCLPYLVQIPVFIGLNRVLSSAIELYKAPFLWIPDLSAKDPYYILPVFVGVCFALQALYGMGGPKTTGSSDPKQGLSNVLMAIIFSAVFSNFAAGLSLYFGFNTLLALIQTYLQKKLRA